jgi:hypothetical protein
MDGCRNGMACTTFINKRSVLYDKSREVDKDILY